MAIPGAAVRRFDAWAPYYDESQLRPAYDAAHRAVLHLVTRVGMRPRRVLDVGCGTARLPRAVADRFPDAAVIGLDPSGPMLSVASEDRRLGLLRGAAETLPFADDCFDLVVSTAAFRHWSDPAGAMTEIARVMAPDGLLAMADLFATERGGLIPIWSRRSPHGPPPGGVSARGASRYGAGKGLPCGWPGHGRPGGRAGSRVRAVVDSGKGPYSVVVTAPSGSVIVVVLPSAS